MHRMAHTGTDKCEIRLTLTGDEAEAVKELARQEHRSVRNLCHRLLLQQVGATGTKLGRVMSPKSGRSK